MDSHPANTPSGFADLCELFKARLNTLVLLTTLVGFTLGSRGRLDWGLLLWTLLGTALLAAGAAALNQVFERDLDALMRRTRDRPLPAGRMAPGRAALGGAAASVAGAMVLGLKVNLLTAMLGAVTLFVYLFVYTPMKRRTPINTLVGAVPGALPPVIGWAAARGEIGAVGWALFVFQFFWQMPHFLAIAWLYREDYARAGLRMLPVLDPSGERTAHHALSHAIALLMVSLAPVLLRLAGPVYGLGALLSGAGFCWLTVRFLRQRDNARARRLFLGSVIYLPVVLGLMVWDKLP